MCNEKGKWSIDDYVNGDCSICREERQYALYLSNVLRYYGIKNDEHLKKLNDDERNYLKEIFQKCGLDFEKDIIEDVFYEATFMRDIFERNRRYHLTEDKKRENLIEVYSKRSFKHKDYIVDYQKSFNQKLIDFCCQVQSKGIKEINYGHNELPNDRQIINCKNQIRAMMNAKPDLAVLFEHNGEKQLKFLECKFSSTESNYSGDGDKPYYSQIFIQNKIGEFLCDEQESRRIFSEKVKFCKNKNEEPVCFCRDDKDKTKISIHKLIQLERMIFI